MVELINREYVEWIYRKIIDWKNDGKIPYYSLSREIINIPKLIGDRKFKDFLDGLNYLVLKKSDRDYNWQIEEREQWSKKKRLDKICRGVDLDNKKEVEKLLENSNLGSLHIKIIYEMLDLLDNITPK